PPIHPGRRRDLGTDPTRRRRRRHHHRPHRQASAAGVRRQARPAPAQAAQTAAGQLRRDQCRPPRPLRPSPASRGNPPARWERPRKLLGHAAAVPVQKIMQMDAVQHPDYKSEVWADHHSVIAEYARLLLDALEEAGNPDYPTPVIPHVGAIQYKNNPDVPDNFQRLKIAAGYHGGEIPAWFPDPQISHETCTGNTSFGIALEPQGAERWMKRRRPTDPTDPKRAALAVLFG